MSDINALSLAQAQKLIILQQKLHIPSNASKGVKGTLECIKHLGYVQIDSISVIVRAHHHSLYNRVGGYKEQHLDSLLASTEIFEYWSHAAAYLPIENYRYSLPRKLALKSGAVHWFKKDAKLMAHVLEKIAVCGPLMAKDFKVDKPKKAKSGWWEWKPAKIALEQLFMQGDLMVTQRKGFQKEYDLTSRVLPSTVDTSEPTQAQYCEFLIVHYLKSQGIAKTEHFAYLLKGMKQDIKTQLQLMLDNGVLQQLSVAGQLYFSLPGSELLLAKKLTQQKVKILSPFDNLLIQRKRMKELFTFDYQIECYVPAGKRIYGYFSLPLLQGQRFVGRMDVKLDRKTGELRVQHLHLHTTKLDQLLIPLAASLQDFMRFQHAQNFHIERVSADCSSLSHLSLKGFKQQLEQSFIEMN